MPQIIEQNPQRLTLTGLVFDGVPLYRGYPRQAEYLAEELVDVANGDYDITRSGLMPFEAGLKYSEGDRQMVVRWLSKLPKLPPRMLKEISEYCLEIEFGTRAVSANPKGGKINLKSSLLCYPKTTRAMFAYMMAALLDASYAENFVKCPECGIWFFDIPSGRRKRVYCTKQHQQRFRQRRWQQSKRAEK